MAAARAMYGFTSAPGIRLSTRRPAPWPDGPEAAGAVVLAPDHGGGRPAVGHVAAVGVDVGGEAPGQLVGGVELAGQELRRPTVEKPRRVRRRRRPAPSAASSVAASHRLVWMWHDDPASSIDHLAMKVAARPSSPAISLTPFLNTRWRSADLERRRRR